MSAADRGWGPGWPNCQRDKIVNLSVHGVSFPGGVRRETKPIFEAFLREFHDRVEALHDGWCWGFACRPIGGTSTPSNHSWGLAVDINAPEHPWGKRGTFTDAQAKLCRELAKKYDLRWGGDYSSKPDEMHFEYMGTRDQALAFAGGYQEDDMFCKHGDEGPKVEALQRLLLAAGAKLPEFGADADYGDETARALKSVVGGDGKNYGPVEYAKLMSKLGGEGARGPKGDRGSRGPRGPQGPPGPKPILSVDIDYE